MFAVRLLDGGNEDDALGAGILERRCSAGNAQSCFVLGHNYGSGGALPLDLAKAQSFNVRGLDLEEVRCAQGDSFACYVLSSDYHHGDNVPHDPMKAWLYAHKYCALVRDACPPLSPSAYGLPEDTPAPE